MKPESQDQRDAVVAEAASWIGTPYQHRGRLKGIAADCAGLPLCVYETAGVIPPTDVGFYSEQWMLNRSEEVYLKWVRGFGRQIGHKLAGGMTIEGDAPGVGDFVVWKWWRTFSHGAIVEAWPKIIHAYVDARMVTRDDASIHEELLRREAFIFTLWG